MGMTTSVVGIKPPDTTFKKMLKIWQACKAAAVEPPKLVQDYFNNEDPDEAGVKVDLFNHEAVTPFKDESSEGFNIEVGKLPVGVKIVRVYNSW